MNGIQALYLHVPFCASRCAYCGFATQACHDDALMDAYVDALGLQLRRAARAGLLGGVRTVYLGGGTPTHLGARRLNSLVYLLSLSVNLEGVEEFTVECNPESLDERMVKDLYALGVGRFSIGAQSFDDNVLRLFGRAHDATAIEQAVKAVRAREAAFSLDLICGAPGQSMASWRASLDACVELGAGHVSVYPLTVEENTPLAARVAAGECPAPDEDMQADMMLAAEDVLGAAGLCRYEVASYALPGCESRHNTAYWTGAAYLGLGAGAASMLSPDAYAACCEAGVFGAVRPMETTGGEAAGATGGEESANHTTAAMFTPDANTTRIRIQADVDAAAFAAGLGRPGAAAEGLTQREALLEDTMLAFRQSTGLGAASVRRACAAVPELAAVLARLQEAGLLRKEADGTLVPTERGWLMGNEVFSAIWALA